MGEKYIDDDDILDEVGGDDDDVPEVTPRPSKAWRSIERYREMQELRRHLDDFLFEDFSDRNVNDLYL